MDIPLIEQVRIQAQVPVPLVKELQKALGEEKKRAMTKVSARSPVRFARSRSRSSSHPRPAA
jgi:hypothetical protein